MTQAVTIRLDTRFPDPHSGFIPHLSSENCILGTHYLNDATPLNPSENLRSAHAKLFRVTVPCYMCL